ncbi:MAG: hypothetical protein U0518_02745 [Candidatus Gracilibacteria bacterium]
MNNNDLIREIGFDFSWNTEKVWQLDEPILIIPIDTLLWHFHMPFWNSEGTDEYNLTVWDTFLNPQGEISHWHAILNANIQYPLDVMPNKGKLLLLDGLHRLAKLYLMGNTDIHVRIIPQSRIPEIIELTS